ncbi:MAG: hypothetical protein AAGC47_03105 [Bacteroidota bacterium]
MKMMILVLSAILTFQVAAQKRSVYIEEEWQSIPEYPYKLNGHSLEVEVVLEENGDGVEQQRPYYSYEVNENSEPLRFVEYHEQFGTVEAKYSYEYMPGEEVQITKKNSLGQTVYQWQLKYGRITEESSFVNGKPEGTWKYTDTALGVEKIEKYNSNGKLKYVWHYEYDDRGRVEMVYRKNGKKMTQLLVHVHDDSLRTNTVYHFYKKALSAMEIGWSIDRDSIAKMDPTVVAAAYYRAIPITVYGYTEDGRLCSTKIKTQEGRVILNEQTMFDADGQVVQSSRLNYFGMPETSKFYYHEDQSIKSKIVTSVFPDKNIEDTFLYYHNDAGNYDHIKYQSTSGQRTPFTLYFRYKTK